MYIISSLEPKAHTGAYSIPMVRRRRPSSSSSSVVHNAQTSSFQKPLGRLKPNLYEASLGRGNEILFAASGSHDQDGRQAHIW